MVTESVCEMETINDLLDKMTLRQLHLMEDKMRSEVNIETSINNGCFHLAKSRYIMGQTSVSKERLPMEASAEFSASTQCETVEEDNTKQFKIIENNSNTVNPMHWFGVLVPQNLHKAKSIFQNTLNFVVECANIQIQLLENLNNIMLLKSYKDAVKST
ncbi:coiled-coil domain-containing protein 115-like [Zerene cesonia]|uniref:coiled-coil domain-containing protein 115-like n=1 Tax=Zerene cesonia TaxID=33412 RepID=UPI0018E561E7|nr:coiled-coil domain-containing protein 115-like [Zerene cesonia]